MRRNKGKIYSPEEQIVFMQTIKIFIVYKNYR